MTPQLTAIRGVIRELSSLAVQKAVLEASGGDTTAVERQITAFRTVVVGLQAALVPKPGSDGGAQPGHASPDAGSQPAGAAPGPPSPAAARFLEAMEELRVAEAQLHEAPEAPQAAAASAALPAEPAPARQSGSPAAAAVPSRPPAAALPVTAGAAKDAGVAAPPAPGKYMWTAPPMPPPKPAPPAQPASPPAAPAAAPAVVAAPPAAAPPVVAAPPAAPAPAVEAAAPPAGNSRAIAAQKARLERQAAMLAAELATAREESSPRVEAPPAEGGADAAPAASAPAPSSPGMDAATSAKVEVLEAEIASLQSEILRLTSCSWLDTTVLATQMTDASALIASVHAWAAQSTQAALEEALASTQKALDAAAGAVPALTTLEAPAVPSPLDAIASFVAAEFQPFSLRGAMTVQADEPDTTVAAAHAEAYSRAAALPPAARPAAPNMSPPFRSRPVWSEPPALQHTSATTTVALPADLLSALPPELSAQLLRAAEEVAKPLDEPNTLQDFASAMRRETEERRRRQLAAARAAAAAAQPAEELDSMDAGGVL